MLITERFGTPIEYVYFVIFKKKFYIQKIFEGNYYLYREDKEPRNERLEVYIKSLVLFRPSNITFLPNLDQRKNEIYD